MTKHKDQTWLSSNESLEEAKTLDLGNRIAPRPTITKTLPIDYAHIKKELKIASDIMSAYKQMPLIKAPQLLLWGPPGTGKTQFARHLCDAQSFESLEVPHTSYLSSEILSGKERLEALCSISSTMNEKVNKAIIFDEADDIFETGLFSKNSFKALLNQTLEQPSLPVIWIANTVDMFDESYIRRFDYIIYFDRLNKIDTRKLFLSYGKGLRLKSNWIRDLSERYNPAPALITDAISAAKTMGMTAKTAQDFIESKFEQFAKASPDSYSEEPKPVKPKKTAKPRRIKSEMSYRAHLSNTSISLDEISTNLKTHKDAKILCYGPSGTGKTAFAQQIGKTLKRATRFSNASEFMSPQVGQTEKNIRDLFDSAARKGEIIVIDEADSILRSRSMARNSWEITQVNQFLSAVESFKGTCIICTNFEQDLDPALYRRFDLKIAFDYLQPDQSLELFEQLCAQLSVCLDGDKTNIHHALNQHRHLVPGYFSLIARRARFAPLNKGPLQLVEMLAAEQLWTNPPGKKMGFAP